MNPEYLTLDEVVKLHDLLCFLYGGTKEVINLGAIDSAIAQPRQGFGGQDLYPTLHRKAAAYCYFLALNHGFQDGNKRTGVAAAFHFLRKNGVWPACDNDALYEAVMGVIGGTCSIEQLADLLKGRKPSSA